MRTKPVWFALNALIIAALACNLPAGGPTATPTPGAPLTVTPPPVPVGSAAITLTASPSTPLVSVTTATNCRTGPSTAFNIVFTLEVGIKGELVGKNTSQNYWVIFVPGGGGSQCWLWGQHAVTEGNVADLPEFTPPPTPLPTATRTATLVPPPTLTPTPDWPAGPSNLSFTATCISMPFSPDIFAGAELYWTDNADSEDGYHIYYGSFVAVATLGPDSESYYTTLGTGTYIVEAFNSAGVAWEELDVDCP